MNREEILQKARKERDERELLIENKAYKLAGVASLVASLILALYFVADGLIIKSGKVYDYVLIASMLIMIGCVYIITEEIYLYIQLKVRKKLYSALIFGYIALSMAINVIDKLFL